MKRPCFFIVGAAKCGTTALYECLRHHPEIFMPHTEDPDTFWLHKEPLHFCGDLGIADWLRVSDEKNYLELFSEAKAEKRIGEASPFYLSSEEAAERIGKFSGRNGKIIILLRSPVSWMRSFHHDMLRWDYEDSVDFGEALSLEKERSEGRRLPRRNAFAGCLQYRKLARFSDQIERYLKVFGREQIYFGLMEDYAKDGELFLRRILEFLEVDSSLALDVTRENESETLKGTHHFDLAVGRALSRLPGGEGIKRAFQSRLGESYRKCADKIFAPMSDKKIDPILEEELLEEFEPEVAKISELLGRDLSHWNEPRFPRLEHAHHHH